MLHVNELPGGFDVRGCAADWQPLIRIYPVAMRLAETTASWAARVRRRARSA